MASAADRELRVRCLGEALVDLICERPVRSPAEAGAFVPHFGGAVANVAVAAARAGAPVALAGGAGDDPWGHWLLDRLEREGVDVSLFELLPDYRTPLAFVTVDEHGEASYDIHGDTIATTVRAVGDRLDAAVRETGALFLSSNTLVGEDEREVSMRARELALGAGRPVVFDPNLRLGRWGSPGEAAAASRACVPGALLVRCNLAEAELVTGVSGADQAAGALLRAGAAAVVITLGEGGAILRGPDRVDVPGVTVDVLSTVGAGDVLTGTLVARLAAAGFDPGALAEALPDAVAASAAACERWGALE